MKKPIVLSIAVAAILAAQAPQPQTSAGVVRYNRLPATTETLKVKLPRPVEQKLANGIKLLVVESHRVPTISLQIQIPTGNVRDPEGLNGLADATAALIRLGTKTRSSKEIAEQLGELGASIFVGAGLDTGTIGASSLTENFDATLAILADILLNPTFPQDELDKWKARQRASIEQAKSSPGALAQERLMKILYPSDFRKLPQPTLESLENITREKIIEHYKAYYAPSAQWAGVAGDITPKDAVAKLDKALAGWKGGPIARPRIDFPAPIPQKKVYLISRPGSVQTLLVFANLALDRLNPDYIEVQVMNRVLGSGSTSRLFRNIREEKGFTYGIGSFFNASRATNYFTTSTSVRTEVTEPAVAEILKEFQTIRDVPVPAEELSDAKNAIVAGFALGLESSTTVLANWITQRMYGLPEDYWDTYAAKIEAVTAAGVQRVAKKYIPLDNVQIVAVGDAAKITEALKKFGPVELLEVEQK